MENIQMTTNMKTKDLTDKFKTVSIRANGRPEVGGSSGACKYQNNANNSLSCIIFQYFWGGGAVDQGAKYLIRAYDAETTKHHNKKMYEYKLIDMIETNKKEI